MRYLGFSLPFPTRMTVVRLPGGDLWVHSPIAWEQGLAAALAELGPVRHLVAPNTLHYAYLAAWRARFPEARAYGPPDLSARARTPVAVDETLGDRPPPGWAGAFEQLVVGGKVLTEAVFFHRPSRTLVVTDLIENFEPWRVRNPLLRWLLKLSGPVDPDGKAPFDMQWSFHGRRREVRAAAERMIAWAPERIVLAHGRCYASDGQAELRRAFRWALKGGGREEA
jgi:hypothetical protein